VSSSSHCQRWNPLVRGTNIPKGSLSLDIEEFPHLKKWLYALLERPGFERGRNVPTKHKAFDVLKLSEEEKEKQAEANRAWILKGMQDDAKK
jgi:glutathione S-transferase